MSAVSGPEWVVIHFPAGGGQFVRDEIVEQYGGIIAEQSGGAGGSRQAAYPDAPASNEVQWPCCGHADYYHGPEVPGCAECRCARIIPPEPPCSACGRPIGLYYAECMACFGYAQAHG